MSGDGGAVCWPGQCDRGGGWRNINLATVGIETLSRAARTRWLQVGACVGATNISVAAKANGTMNSSVKTVLVVEDNDINMRLFHDLLEAHG